jgi:16S rRNA (guanine527-N7)-methyltransferase
MVKMSSSFTPPTDFLEKAQAAGIRFESGDLDRLEGYVAALIEANQVMNLTAIAEPTEVWHRHVLESLRLLGHLRAFEVSSVLDLGSGGGCPGLPLAIVAPDIRMTLLEATGKKANFLKDVSQFLELENVTVINARAENHGRFDGRAMYEVVLARAVGPLNVLVELAVPLLCEGGVLVAVKGDRAEAEIAHAATALKLLGAKVQDTLRMETATVVSVVKESPTNRLYPRRPGEPKRSPLGGKMASKSRL